MKHCNDSYETQRGSRTTLGALTLLVCFCTVPAYGRQTAKQNDERRQLIIEVEKTVRQAQASIDNANRTLEEGKQFQRDMDNKWLIPRCGDFDFPYSDSS